MVAEQCPVSEAADSTGPSKGTADSGIKILAEYPEQILGGEPDAPVLCVEDCNMNAAGGEPCSFCGGRADGFPPHAASSGFFEADQELSACDTWGLSQPFDERALYCECFKPCKSPEHRANHSLASKCSPCREHCAGRLQLFQPCQPLDGQLESSDSEPGESEVNGDGFSPCETSDAIPGGTKLPELLPHSEPCECSDSERSGASASTPDLYDSEDSLDRAAEGREYDPVQDHEDEDDVEELSDEDSVRFTAVDVDCDDVEYAPLVGDASLYPEDDSIRYDAVESLADPNDFCENDDVESNADDEQSQESAEPCHSDSGSEFCAEEDCTSDYSSGETRSCQTCCDGSITSEPGSESSGESEKFTQEDSGDEQWDSFEDEEETQQNKMNGNLEKQGVAIVLEDYFDLFDRADYCDPRFAQKQRYISCFDGGDIHHRLHLEEEAQKLNGKNALKYEEVLKEDSEQGSDTCSVEAPDAFGEDLSQRDESCDSEDQCGSSSAGDEADGDESETQENSDGAEDDGARLDGEGCTVDGGVSKLCDEETDSRSSSASEDSMCAPFAKEISVEGDAYEDELFSSLNGKPEDIATSRPEREVFISCSEMEPYCSLLDIEEMGELCEAGVEDYYSYHVINMESFVKPEFLLGGRLYRQRISGKLEKEVESQLADIRPNKSATFEITKVVDLNRTRGDGDGCGTEDISREIRLPSDVIHSVVSESSRSEAEGSEEDEASEQSGESDEEQSDDESDETCECEYCVPPAEQVPAEPLLPASASGRICVVIDLDETLVHSSFKPVNNADFVIPVEIDGTVHQVYVLKRPHVDEFLRRMGELFECVLFTASLSKYADPVSDLLDPSQVFQSRLFRESCVFHKGNYVKDLSRLGRDLNKVIIIDNSPASYILHPDNAVAVASWFDDTSDTELRDLIPFFERLSLEDDVYDLLRQQRTSS